MHDYDNAQQFLESAIYCRLEQNRIIERIGVMRARCLKITPTLSAVPGGGNSDAQAQWAALADEERRLTEMLQEEINRAKEIEAFIDKMETPIYQELLRYRYIDFLTVPAVVRRLTEAGYTRSQRQVERLLSAALIEAENLFFKLKGDYTHDQKRNP